MKTVFLHDLIQMPNTAGVELHAVDLTIYLVFSAQGDSLLPVVGKNGERLRFPSRAAAQLALKEAGLTRLDFVHHSAYGEMVGLDYATGTTELRQTVDL
jgi:hypothetical protein